MKTIIIPCGGEKLLNGKNILKLRHPDGKLLLEKTLLSLKINDEDRIIMTIYHKNDADVMSNLNAIRRNINNKIEFYFLDEKTNDSAETVYLTIKNNNVHGNIIIKDVNNSISYKESSSTNFIAGISVMKCDVMNFDIRQMGFILLNDTNQVLDVIEKKLVSEYISVGMYGFSSCDDFIFAYERLRDGEYPIKKLFINNIMSYLIGYKNEVFHYLNVDKFEDWSTDYSWNLIQNKYADCFIDIDYMFKIRYDSIEMSETLSLLQDLQERGNILIGFTSLTRDKYNLFMSEMPSLPFKFNNIIYSCSYSSIKRILRSKNDVREFIYNF